ncbi:HAMP domain-containing sensor histidine kinase [Xanthocytophaga agilis]|uniref:histidine kinase n=1 Tax=Xanthocytophaga agilis TaxID=3048010 RepID=A0AAE3R603_9BACT|nr:HAMP domain-containing sensor histidine kinase [Xanthocytophaga agilis]MDJ1504276.1 HAMP domain-containing sensor histidine kinase [Xanthocytophaga agilis]
MKHSKRSYLSILLMSSSLVLLLLFQVIWLQKVYNEQYEILYKDANTLFRTTMMDLQDSVVRKNMKLIKADTLVHRVSPSLVPAGQPSLEFEHRSERVLIQNHRMRGVSSVMDTLPDKTQVKIFISSDQRLDSSEKVLGSIAENIGALRKKNGNYNFLVKLDIDSIPVGAIAKPYQQSLIKANIDLPFQVLRLPAGIPSTKARGIQTELFVGFPSRTNYMAYFPEYRMYLFRHSLPQLIFSVFLTLITSFSFFLIYRNFQRQKRLNQLKNDFISNITHELKTPITTVGIAIEALRNFNVLQDPTQTKEYLEISRQELNRLNIMVDKILKTAVFENSGVDIQWDTIDMEKLIEQVQQSMQLQYEKLGAEVVFTREGNKFSVRGDTVHLVNVVYNLIDNALKYTAKQPSITILLRELWDKIEVSVQDDGIGIATEFQHKIFEKFFRVPTGDVHNAKGYGLGLNYVNQVIEKHNGQIKVQSEPNKGSCFTIYLPKVYAEN